jgi:hypothetical protein
VREDLREHGKTERERREAEAASGAELRQGCWPAWRILDEAGPPVGAALLRWWESHAQVCETCRRTLRRVREENPEVAGVVSTGPAGISVTDDRPVIVVAREALPERRSRWAAASAEDLADAIRPLPRVSFEQLESPPGSGLSAFWTVAWGERLFLLLAGDSAALTCWCQGARVEDEAGDEVGAMIPADMGYVRRLCPSGRIEGVLAACLQSVDPLPRPALRSLRTGGSDSVDSVLSTHASVRKTVSAAVGELAELNKPRPFVDRLPALMPNLAERETLCFYLRLLVGQGRLDQDSVTALRGLGWLSEDLRRALASGGSPNE